MGRFHLMQGRDTSLPLVARNIKILAPTFLEYWALQRTLPHACVYRAGVRLARWKGFSQTPIVVVCGLAGALASGLAPGTVLIPHQVSLTDGRTIHCDASLVQRLITATHTLHLRLHTGPLLTAQSLVVGNDRRYWAEQGFIAADMETGLLIGQNLRVAALRVVLDCPEHDLSSHWLHPIGAVLQPHLWQQFFWLSRVAPRYALQAAQVLKVGLGTEPDALFVE